MIPLLADEHVRGSVVRGLRDRGVDVVTIQDAGLRSAPDERLIDHAREENRVIVTNDTDILGIVASRPHPGVIFQTTQFVDPGDLLGAIVRLLNTIPDPAFENNVFYVP